MALTPEQWQALVKSETKPQKLTALLGDAGAAETEFDDNLPLWWEVFADKAMWGPRLRYLYTKKQAIEWLSGQVWDHVDFGDADVNERLSQYNQQLTEMAQAVLLELTKVETRRRSMAGASGTIERTAPIQPCDPAPDCTYPDPNDRAYRGDTLRRVIPNAYPR